jgi:hypothetical protein
VASLRRTMETLWEGEVFLLHFGYVKRSYLLQRLNKNRVATLVGGHGYLLDPERAIPIAANEWNRLYNVRVERLDFETQQRLLLFLKLFKPGDMVDVKELLA